MFAEGAFESPEIFSVALFSFSVTSTGGCNPSESSMKRGQNLSCEKPHLLHERFIRWIHEPKIEIVGPGIDELLDLVTDLGGSTEHRGFDAGRGRLFRAFGGSPAILALPHISRIARHMFFFFNDTATTEIYTLSLHDALPI